jgi:hypothetical protein
MAPYIRDGNGGTEAIHLPTPLDFLSKKFYEELIAYFPRCDTGHIENVACVFVTAVKFLPNRCLATIRGHTHSQQRDLISLRYFSK